MLVINSRTCVFDFCLCAKTKINHLLPELEDAKHTTPTIYKVCLRTWTKFSFQSKKMKHGSVLARGWSFEPFQMTNDSCLQGSQNCTEAKNCDHHVRMNPFFRHQVIDLSFQQIFYNFTSKHLSRQLILSYGEQMANRKRKKKVGNVFAS